MAKSADVEIRLRAIDDTAKGINSAKRRLKQFEKLAGQQEKVSKQQEKSSKVQATAAKKQESAARQQARAVRDQERSQARAGRREVARQSRMIRAQEVAQERSVVRQEKAVRRQARMTNPQERAARSAGIRQTRAARQGARGGQSSSYVAAMEESKRAAGGDSGGGVMGFASARVMGGVAAIGGVAGVATQAADFESLMTKIQQKAGATAEQMDAVRKDVLDLATNGQVAASIEEIASAYARGAAGGIPLDELREFSLLAAKTADAFEMPSGEVSDFFAGIKNVLNVPKDRLQPIADLINSLADSGIADESGIVRYIDQAGAMSKTIGLSVEETAAFGAALGNLKVPAFKAATAMNSILTKILAPQALSGPASEAFETLVGDVDGFAKSLNKDADGAIVGLLKKLKALDKASRAGIVSDLFGQDHLDVVMQMVEGIGEIERNLNQAHGDGWLGSLDRSYALKLDDMLSQWQVFKNTIAELSIDIGSAGMPVLQSSLEGARALVKDIGAGIEIYKSELDMTELLEAKQAVIDLGTALGTLFEQDPSQSAIGQFFSDLALATNQAAASINAIDAAMKSIQSMMPGAKDASGRPVQSSIPDRQLGMGPNGPRLREGGLIDRAIDTGERVYDHLNGRKPRMNYDPAMYAPRTPPIRSFREAESASMGAMKTQFGSMLAPGGQSFKPGTTGQSLIDEVDVDRIRQELEAGGRSLTTAGTTAAAAITAAGPVAGESFGTTAGTTFQSSISGAAASFGSQAAASFNATVKIPSMPSGPAGLPRANAASATTMPDAGRAGG